ncbi:hypothetical protein JVU11DRAFT_2685 [Chiua virens]|nr:hypothetical protein JVU11DRAFT_2685 [Chiua virens]
MYKQKATATSKGHFANLAYRGRPQTRAEVATAEDTDAAECSSQILDAIQAPMDTPMNTGNVKSVVIDDLGQPTTPTTFVQKVQDIFSALPSLSTSIGSPLTYPRPTVTPPTPPQTESGAPFPVSDTRPPENSPAENGWQSWWSSPVVGRLRPSFSKKSETASSPGPSKAEILDCIDDNNSVMMYGPLEPDDTSEVEIACSEIVSVHGDGSEIRTPQSCFSPLPSESLNEAMMGRGPRSPPPRCIPLPGFSPSPILSPLSLDYPSPRFSPLPLGSIDEALRGAGGPSPLSHFASLPPQSIDQVIMGGGGGGVGESSSIQGKEGESEFLSGATGATQVLPITEPTADQPRVREYRVWLPSSTKLSVQTMWWGFRIYLPPPVLDVLNNKQLEAVKRAAIITTALQWLMEHLPLALLPPQMHPGVAILRYLVPWVGYMGGFIAWGWSAIRSFDKGIVAVAHVESESPLKEFLGYGVVLTATWILPFILIPGTWEVEEVPKDSTANTAPEPGSA